MNLLNKIEENRTARKHAAQVATQLFYIFSDYRDRHSYRDHDIYENIHAAIDNFVSYTELFKVRTSKGIFAYNIRISSLFDHENMIKFDRKTKVSKLTVSLDKYNPLAGINYIGRDIQPQPVPSNKLFEAYFQIDSPNFNEATLDVETTYAIQEQDLPEALQMYADSSVLGEVLVRFFTDIEDKTIVTDDYEFELE